VLAEVTVKYKRVQSTQPGVEVRGIALLGDHLYVIRKHSSQIDVLQPSSLASECSIAVSDMTDPGSMAGCSALKSLYITVFRKKEVIKVNVAGAVRKYLQTEIQLKFGVGNCDFKFAARQSWLSGKCDALISFCIAVNRFSLL